MTLPLAGAKIRASDLATVFPANTDAWTTYTPTLTQGVTVTKSLTRNRYTKIGRTIVGNVYLSLTSAGTAGGHLKVGLPEACTSGGGSAWFFDASSSTRYVLSASLASATEFWFLHDTSGANVFGAAPAVTVASGDLIEVNFTCETAA